MVCRCGHSLVPVAKPGCARQKLPGNLGCFVWLFAVNLVWAELLALLMYALSLKHPEAQHDGLTCSFS